MFSTTGCQKGVPYLAFLLLIITGLPSHADIVFTAPPRENPDTAKALYEPIAEKLSSLLKENVIFEAPHG